jgi:hypothetical protein
MRIRELGARWQSKVKVDIPLGARSLPYLQATIVFIVLQATSRAILGLSTLFNAHQV